MGNSNYICSKNLGNLNKEYELEEKIKMLKYDLPNNKNAYTFTIPCSKEGHS